MEGLRETSFQINKPMPATQKENMPNILKSA